MHTIRFLLLLNLLPVLAFSQEGDIAQFAIWKPKDGHRAEFEAGYKKHLKWHEENGDTWGWWGWFIVSGPRYGQFVDATFSRSWNDFDNAVKPAEDLADNRVHVFPFGDIQTIFKVRRNVACSTNDTFNNKLKICRMLTVTVSNLGEGRTILKRLKEDSSIAGLKSLQTYEVIDGGNLNEFIVLLGFNSWEEFGKSQDVGEKLSALQDSMKLQTIRSVQSETMVYREDLSWFPRDKK